MLQLDRNRFIYNALFCEENIWHLVNSLQQQGLSATDMQVVVISNNNKTIAMYEQLAAPADQLIVWDYHVVLLLKHDLQAYILDFDSRLGLICAFSDYIRSSFPEQLPPQYQCRFRVISADKYLQYFDSDRSHMRGMIAAHQYPQYDPIRCSHAHKLSLTELFNFKLALKNTLLLADLRQLMNLDSYTSKRCY